MTALATRALNTAPARFADLGYCVFRGALPPAVMAQAAIELDRLIAAKPDVRPEHLNEPHVESAFWLSLCTQPGVLDAVRTVLGDDLVLIMSHLIVKPAYDGRRVAWHQDQPTWPSVQGTDIVTAWLAIDTVDTGNGCMHVIPRTQQGYRALPMVEDKRDNVFEFGVEVTPELEARKVPIELAIGDLSLHDAYALHGSEANTSPRRRAGFTMRYANARTVRIDTTKHWVPVYVVSGGAPAEAGYVDLRR